MVNFIIFVIIIHVKQHIEKKINSLYKVLSLSPLCRHLSGWLVFYDFLKIVWEHVEVQLVGKKKKTTNLVENKNYLVKNSTERVWEILYQYEDFKVHSFLMHQ